MFLINLYWYVNEIKKILELISEREPYHCGYTKKGVDNSYEELIKIGYQWDYFTWEDIGEGVSARKLYSNRQVHIRIFTDNEVKIHDEYNYEFEPLKHYNSETLKLPTVEEIEKIKIVLGI